MPAIVIGDEYLRASPTLFWKAELAGVSTHSALNSLTRCEDVPRYMDATKS